ncbi:MAG TPA: EpsD family peptidyl-prolyl cis-trans isomerase [Burkholderiaceae bacterium]|nr:EpsD family peptidyl-prolyl cis-trans isomerase [Burkholderiaceae bacterium]
MRMTPEAIRPVVLSLSALAALALSACSESRSATATQVAVKVNKDEITTLQVNEQLARLPNGISSDQQEPATRKVLSGLVTQQLLVQQAVERKLDRDPQVLGALEAARLNILAQAYVQRVILPQAKPTEQEVRKYYADNPALFSERKIYRLQELSIEANADQEKQIELTAAHAKSLKELADYLRQKKIAFSADSGVRTAEQLPLARLPQIAQLKTGNVLVFSTGSNRASALEVLASESQPVDDKKATPVIEQYLTNRKRDELASLEVKRLRDAAKIQYIGDFAKFVGEPAGNTTTVAADKPAPGDQDKGIAALR